MLDEIEMIMTTIMTWLLFFLLVGLIALSGWLVYIGG
jgi:hypothetical protein